MTRMDIGIWQGAVDIALLTIVRAEQQTARSAEANRENSQELRKFVGALKTLQQAIPGAIELIEKRL